MGKNNRPKVPSNKTRNAVNLHSQSRPWNPSLQMQVKSVLFSFGTHVALFKHGSERQGSTKHKLRQQSDTKKGGVDWSVDKSTQECDFTS